MGRMGDDSQRFFLHSDTGADYAAQILAEEKRKSRSGKIGWKQVRKNNHLLDCEVYAAACVDNEWNPSFSILAAQMEARTKTAPPKSSKPPAKSNAGPAVPGQLSPEENRGLW
jgi:phage terminase large subunit GpA-like protein